MWTKKTGSVLNVNFPYEVRNADFWRLQLKAQIEVLAHHGIKHSPLMAFTDMVTVVKI